MLMWLIPGDFAPFLTATTVMANFSMLKLYRDDFNQVNYFVGMFALMTLSFPYEKFVINLNLSDIYARPIKQ